MDFGSIVLSSTLPLIQVLALSLFGMLMASSRFKVLSPSTRFSLSQLTFYLFNPSLILSSAPQSFTPEAFSTFWLFPFSCFYNMAFGFIFSIILVQIVKVPRNLRAIVILAATIGNYGNLTIVLASSLCTLTTSPIYGRENCEKDVVTFVSSGFWVGSIAIWVVGYNVIVGQKHKKVGPIDDEGQQNGYLNGDTPEPSNGHTNGHINGRIEDVESPSKESINRESDEIQEIDDVVQIDDSDSMLESRNEFEIEDEREGLVHSNQPNQQKKRPNVFIILWETLKRYFVKITSSKLFWLTKKILNPPVLATVISIIIGCIPFLRNAYLGEGVFVQTIRNILNLLGSVLIPSMMLVMGGNLVGGPVTSSLSKKAIAGVCIVRLVLLPSVQLLGVYLADLAKLMPKDFLFRYVILINGTVPTATNLGTLVTLAGVGQADISVLFFWEYVFALIMTCFWNVVYFSVLL